MTGKRKYNIIKFLENLYLAILWFQFFAGLTAVFLIKDKFAGLQIAGENEIKVFIMLLNLAFIFTVKSIERRSKDRINSEKDLNEKLREYKSSRIGLIAIFLIINLANLSAFLIEQKNIYLIIFTVILILFFAYKPGIKAFINSFNLSLEEKKFLESNY